MGAENFNRQFILLDFADLDNPDFLSFTRSPEFSTYLVMRRHVWRSRDPHYMGLHQLYATGFLACSLERDQIAELLSLSLVSISNDIQALVRRQVLESRRTGRQNIFVLGRWVEDAGAYYEHFYLNRLYVRSKENLISELRDGRDKENLTSDDNPTRLAEIKKSLPNNREGNRGENREGDPSNIRSASTSKNKGGTRGRHPLTATEPTPEAPLTDSERLQGGARAREVTDLAADRFELAGLVEDLRRELNDQAPAGASLTRAVNLYRRAGLSLDEFRGLMYDARRLTQQHTASIRAQLPDAGTSGRLPGKAKMAYFFSVLENSLGLDEVRVPAAGEGTPATPEGTPATPEPQPGAVGGTPAGNAVPGAGPDRAFIEAAANAAMSRGVNWRLARELAREDPHLLADWLDHGGAWALARDPGAALAELIRAGERPPRTRISGD